MDKGYQKFLHLAIDLASVGMEQRGQPPSYFCTPKGASTIGWAGVDGIHFCFLRGCGNIVFSVSPMNTAPDYVHPFAENFTDFLRLLLACGDTAALEQAWMWDETQFASFLSNNPPTQKQRQTLTELAEKMHLRAMEQPFAYLKTLQSTFDYSKIRYTKEYAALVESSLTIDSDSWKVYFDGGFFGHTGRCRPGKEIRLDKKFRWADHDWCIPAVYRCSQGLVLDLCMRAEAEEIDCLPQSRDTDKECDLSKEIAHPFSFDFTPCLQINEKNIRFSHGESVQYQPYLPDGATGAPQAKGIVDHYALNADDRWIIFRYTFRWESKRPPTIKTLSLIMEQQPQQIPGQQFEVHAPKDTVSVIHPVSGECYTLTVQDLRQQVLPKNNFPADHRWFCPTHYTKMCYTLAPLPTAPIRVVDSEEGDQPLEIMPQNDAALPQSQSSACIGIIGGADGPTAILFQSKNQTDMPDSAQYTACSSLHFEPITHAVKWRIFFSVKQFEALSLSLTESFSGHEKQ